VIRRDKLLAVLVGLSVFLIVVMVAVEAVQVISNYVAMQKFQRRY
jgi:hypothetical protein